MNPKRIAILGVVAAVLAAMIAGATTSNRRPLPPQPAATTGAAVAESAALAAEVDRLRERLRPSTEPAQPARNLFQFAPAARPRPSAAPPAAPLPPVPVTPAAPPPLALVGLATAAGIRTAIVSGYGDLFLVREGEAVGAQYRVTAIGAEGVELTNLADGTTLRLALK